MTELLKFFKSILNSKDNVTSPLALKVDATEFPPHLFIPSKSESVDIRNLASLISGENFELLRYVCPRGVTTVFISYALFNDALLFSDVEFIPRVNGARILPFHGNPAENYKLALGVAPDISNASSIPCLVTLNPGDVLTVNAINNALVSSVMGFRFSGYQISNLDRKNARVGA